jgi:WD40 repeat protein
MRKWQVGEIIDDRYQVKYIHEDGGMGLVYRVHHLEWNTDLALKVPKPERFQTEEDRARFVAEAENWVGLGLHPHICACYYVQTLDAQMPDRVPHVFAEYVPGGSLTRWIAEEKLYEDDASPVPILDVAIQVAWGLEHAHTHGLVHRDVKPDNILLSDDRTARVTDFGIADALTSGSDLSRGWRSQQFASPEQLSPDDVLDHRTDIFSFGVSVLAMVTRGASWMIGPGAGPALNECQSLPRPLRAVLDRCLAPAPQERYGSMHEVAADLAEVYRQEVGRSYPRPLPQAAELRAAELNNRALSLLDLGRTTEADKTFARALAADLSHLEATYNAGLVKWRAGECSDTDVLGAIEATGDDSPYASYLLAEIHLERGDLASARRLLSGLDGMPEVRAALRALKSADLPDASCVSITRFPWQSTRTWETSTLKIRLRADGRFAITGSDDGTVRLWDMRTGECVHLLKGHSQSVSSADLTPDGRFAVSSASDGAVRYWDLTDGRCLLTFTPRGPQGRISPQHVRITADGRHVLGTGRDGDVMVWNFPGGWPLRTLEGHQRDLILDVAGNPRLLLTSGNEDPRTSWEPGEKIESAFTVRLWDLTTGECLKVLSLGRSPVRALRLTDDGRIALVGRYDQTIRLYDLENGRQLADLVGHPSGFPSTLALSQDGALAMAGGLDRFGMPEGTPNAVRLWSLKNGRCLRTFDGHRNTVQDIALVPGEPYAISVSGDDTARLWRFPGRYAAPFQISRPRTPAELVEFQSMAESLVAEARAAMGHGDHATALARLTEARKLRGHERAPYVRSAWRDLSVNLQREGLRDAWPVRTMRGHTSAVFSVAVSGDGRIAVSGGLDGEARIWDVAKGKCLHVLPEQPARLRTTGVTMDGTKALTACADGTLAVWSTATGERISGIDGRVTHGAEPASFSATGRLALVGAHDSTIRLWNLEEEELLLTLAGYAKDTRIRDVWLYSDCRRAVSAASDRTVRLWDLTTGECVRTMTGHSHEVAYVCMSPDGRHALSCGDYTDTTIRLWNLDTGRCERVLSSPGVRTVQFSPDSRYAVAAGRDTSLRLWDLTTGTLLRTLDAHTQAAEDVVMTPDSCYLLSAGSDKNLRLWELDWGLMS